MPSGRSYLLALGGSELLLLSFTLAAVRLRCVFSPIFLLSWSSQVSNGARFFHGPDSLLDVCHNCFGVLYQRQRMPRLACSVWHQTLRRRSKRSSHTMPPAGVVGFKEGNLRPRDIHLVLSKHDEVNHCCSVCVNTGFRSRYLWLHCYSSVWPGACVIGVATRCVDGGRDDQQQILPRQVRWTLDFACMRP